MLEEDALRFDQFLKDNDQKAVQAIKRAEAETKAKSEKVAEIKKLPLIATDCHLSALDLGADLGFLQVPLIAT